MKCFRQADMGSMAAEIAADMERTVIEHHAGVMQAVQAELVRGAPVDKGEFRASITPYGSAGPAAAAPNAQGKRTPQSDAEVDQALGSWSPGQPSGHASADPAARRLAFGGSKQASFGWMVRSVVTGVARARIRNR